MVPIGNSSVVLRGLRGQGDGAKYDFRPMDSLPDHLFHSVLVLRSTFQQRVRRLLRKRTRPFATPPKKIVFPTSSRERSIPKALAALIAWAGLLMVAVQGQSPPRPFNILPATVVIGQRDFANGLENQGATPSAKTLFLPAQTLVVGNKLIIADAGNNRVLIYNKIPTTANAAADVVIGQKDFEGVYENQDLLVSATTPTTLDRPSGLATDGVRLFILDRDNHRVLIYNQVPTANNAAADVVIGHDTMFDGSWGGESLFNDTKDLSAKKLSSGPTGLAYDAYSGKLIVYDSDNDRVLIYNKIPTTNGAAADVVIGQPDFVHNATNQGGPVGPNTLDLSTASGVGTYNGKLLIADRDNHRVLIFNQIPTTNNARADVVIGQSNFTSNLPNQGGPVSSLGLDIPRGAQVDIYGRLFIPEAGNARVLIYNQIPETNNAAADFVFNLPDFVGGAQRTTTKKFEPWPYHVEFFSGHMIVTEPDNNRVLIYPIDPPDQSASRFVNIASRSLSGAGNQQLIAGFVTKGSGTKQVLLRAIGPSLASFGVQGVLSDPQLRLHNATGLQLLGNDDWKNDETLSAAFQRTGAFSLPASSKDAALLAALGPGAYSAVVSASSGQGVALVEAYETEPTPSIRFVNMSVRSQAGAGDNTLVMGFVLVGSGPKTLLIRGIGPALGDLGISDAIADPILILSNQSGQEIYRNDDWGGSPALVSFFPEVGAFPLKAGSKDACLLVTLKSGAYSAQIRTADNRTGTALLELYEAP